MNVLYIVKYKNTPGKCAYVVVSREQSKRCWYKSEPDELTVTCLPPQIRNEANKIISDHGQCHIYYSHDRGWCCTCDYRDIEADEYYAGEYTKHEFDYLRKLKEVLI